MSTPAAPSGPAPAPTAHGNPLGRRIVAGLIDAVLMGVVFTLLAARFGEAQASGASFSLNLQGAPALLFFALFLLYYIGLEATLGATLGKLALGLRVGAAADGRPASFGAIAIRNVLRIIDGLPVLYLVGFVCMLATGPRRQRVGDLAANTVVQRAGA